MNKNFYTEMSAFSNFNEVTKDIHYKDVPGDWFVVITDIRGSTQAISEGRYQAVNFVGAACISAVEEVLAQEVPYVFGGDGASFLIAPDQLEKVSDALNEVRHWAQLQYSLSLRIGVIPVSKVHEQSKEIKIAKYNVAYSKNVVKIKGGGLSLAESLMKQNEEYELEKKPTQGMNSLKNLTCRWSPISSHHGKILTLMVKCQNESNYSFIINQLNKVVGTNVTKLNPVKPKHMSYKSFSQMMSEEKKCERSFLSKTGIMRFLEICLCVVVFKFKINILGKALTNYLKEMATHSDFRKFDDCLRMVIDCSDYEVERIVEMLTQLHEGRVLNFGVAISDTALMTCLVKSIKDGEHIHFVDGAGGGYTLAAKNLKMQVEQDLGSRRQVA